jgi:hypothetical protein
MGINQSAAVSTLECLKSPASESPKLAGSSQAFSKDNVALSLAEALAFVAQGNRATT